MSLILVPEKEWLLLTICIKFQVNALPLNNSMRFVLKLVSFLYVFILEIEHCWSWYLAYMFWDLFRIHLLIVVSGFDCIRTSCSMKSYRLSELTPAEVQSLKARPRIDFTSIFSTVSLCLFLYLDCSLRSWNFFVVVFRNEVTHQLELLYFD